MSWAICRQMVVYSSGNVLLTQQYTGCLRTGFPIQMILIIPKILVGTIPGKNETTTTSNTFIHSKIPIVCRLKAI